MFETNDIIYHRDVPDAVGIVLYVKFSSVRVFWITSSFLLSEEWTHEARYLALISSVLRDLD